MLITFLALCLTSGLTLARPAAARRSLPLIHDNDVCSTNDIAGTSTARGACRYTLQYAHVAERWGYSHLLANLSSGSSTEVPPACPQSANTLLNGQTKEDCLYAVLYTPKSVSAPDKLPVFVWVHGGSFVSGSASAPGLDGSYLASKGAVVIFVQYRLGVLGFLPPSMALSTSDPNLGLLDLLNSLKAIQSHVELFGGDPFRVTIGGQSSGAGMIRSLLGAPQSMGLFRAAILQSDPMSYGLASPETTKLLQTALYSSSGPLSSCKTLACLQNISVTQLLNAQDDLLGYAPYTFEGVPLAEVIRPTHSTNTIPNDPTPLLFSNPHALFINPSSVRLLITTTKNEGGSVIERLFPVSVPANNRTMTTTLTALIGQKRAETLALTDAYAPPEGTNSMRNTFEAIITDGVWKCANRAVASAWAKAGGDVWVGEWVEGMSYPSNKGEYCQTAGRVCHEDDIFPIFGINPGVSSSVWARDMADRWFSFIADLDPNPSEAVRECQSTQVQPKIPRRARLWQKYTSDNVFPLGSGEVGECPGIWGGTVPYDWQLFL